MNGQEILTAFLTIQEGCDKFCSFCVVPYTRGAEFSRPAAAILHEARRLVSQGAREISRAPCATRRRASFRMAAAERLNSAPRV